MKLFLTLSGLSRQQKLDQLACLQVHLEETLWKEIKVDTNNYKISAFKQTEIEHPEFHFDDEQT